VLLRDADTLLPQSVDKRVLVDLFHMSMAVKFVNGEACFPDDVAKFIDRSHCIIPFWFLFLSEWSVFCVSSCLFVAKTSG